MTAKSSTRKSTPGSRAPRWRRRKEARPEEILEAALACFAEKGFGPTRLDDVVLRAGIAKGTLYRYFDTKEALFRTVVRLKLVSTISESERAVAPLSAAEGV